MKTFQLIIARVDGPVYDGPAVSVTVPGAAGEMTILAHHAAIISPLRKGTIEVRREDGDTESFSLLSGTLEVSGDVVSILI